MGRRRASESSEEQVTSSRKHRPRPTPRWLAQSTELDEIARRRCLMVLSVLSGETPVTEAITQAEISRGHYYQLEEKAIDAMLEALAPGAQQGRPPEARARIAELEARVQQVVQEKRRAEKLLQLTRKMLPKGSYTTGRGRPKGSRASATAGRPSSARSTSASSGPTSTSSSTPTPSETVR